MPPLSSEEIDRVFRELNLWVFERGWLSSNNVLFRGNQEEPAAVVDTGYASHAKQTVALLESALGPSPLGRILNTHLHSDHCGGNAAIQSRWNVSTWIPAACWDAVKSWDQGKLSFAATDQRCDPFVAEEILSAGEMLTLGQTEWQVLPAPGHDPTALMLYQPDSGVLISGDALWEERLAIVFPELVGEPGFDACMHTLDLIERLAPRVVIPGHGRSFSNVTAALASSRARLEAFQKHPARHRRHAQRALVMFHMFEIGACNRQELASWLLHTPITGSDLFGHEEEASELIDSLERDGVLRLKGEKLYLAEKTNPR